MPGSESGGACCDTLIVIPTEICREGTGLNEIPMQGRPHRRVLREFHAASREDRGHTMKYRIVRP